MARVSVNPAALLDPRLPKAGRALRMAPEILGWRLIRVWSHVTDMGEPLMATDLVATCLKKAPAAVHDALVGAGLARSRDDGHALDLTPLTLIFGDFEWLADLRTQAPAGGRGRAQTAMRDEQGRMVPRDYEAEVLELLKTGAHSRAAIRRTLRANNNIIRRTVRVLLEAGTIVEDAKHALTLPTTDPPVPPTVPDTVTDTVPGTDTVAVPYHAVPSALAPAPAPAPALVSESRPRAPARNRTGTVQGTGTGTGTVSGTVQGTGTVSGTVQGAGTVRRTGPPDRFQDLYSYWSRAGKQLAGDGWRDPGPVAGRHRVREALNHPELLQRSDDEIRHGLDMLRAECQQRERAGHENPWHWYRKAWMPRVLSSACDVPDETTARNRASPRGASPSQELDAMTAAVDAEMAEKNEAERRTRESRSSPW